MKPAARGALDSGREEVVSLGHIPLLSAWA